MSPDCRGPLSGINPYDQLVVVTFNPVIISLLESLRSTYENSWLPVHIFPWYVPL